MLNAYIGQRFPRGRASHFVVGYHVYDKDGRLDVLHILDERTGEAAEFATKPEARAAMRALLKPAKKLPA